MTTQLDRLIQRMRAADHEALGEYLEAMRPVVMGYIQRQLGVALRRKVEPEDIFQEVSADAVRSLPEVKIGERDPFSWLCEIAERRIVDAHRHYFGAQKRDAAREVPLGQPGGDSSRPGLINLLVNSLTTPSQAFSRNAREARLLQAMASLPDDQREALRLRYVEGIPSKEIAQRLNKSDVAIRVMLTRSLKRLQSLLGEP